MSGAKLVIEITLRHIAMYNCLIPALWFYPWLISINLPTSPPGSHSCPIADCCDSVMLDLKYTCAFIFFSLPFFFQDRRRHNSIHVFTRLTIYIVVI